MPKTVLSRRLVRSRAALINKSLLEINDEAGFPPGSGYIYRILDRNNIHLATIDRVAVALGCKVCDILEEIEEETPSVAAPARQASRSAVDDKTEEKPRLPAGVRKPDAEAYIRKVRGR